MYNTRRGGHLTPAGNGVQQKANAASAVGQRRPVVTNNFVPGGQLAGNKGGPQNQPHGGNRPQQNYDQQQVHRGPPQQQQQQQKNLQQQQVQQQLPQVKQEQKILFKNEPQQPQQQPQQQQPLQQQPPQENDDVPMEFNADGTPKKPKPAWMKNLGKVSKKERFRRRNKKLVKILQPKNAVMVLNEMAPSAVYNMLDVAEQPPQFSFYKASVTVEDTEHFGSGKSKALAKASAAEAAIKHLVFKRLKSQAATAAQPENPDGSVAMETDGEGQENTNEAVLPWQHVASFALHKLFANWDDGGNLTERLMSGAGAGAVQGANGGVAPGGPPAEKRPAKKLPANPETMNPIMLLNQMMPHAVYEEISKIGVPPNVVFNYKCSVNGQTFYGFGSSKKAARKLCAFEACRVLLQIQYAADVYKATDNPQVQDEYPA